MPDTFQESTYNGYPIAKIYTGEFKGESQFLLLGLKKAQAVLENIDRLRMWVDQQEHPRGSKTENAPWNKKYD
jgi:hypothetical protein